MADFREHQASEANAAGRVREAVKSSTGGFAEEQAAARMLGAVKQETPGAQGASVLIVDQKINVILVGAMDQLRRSVQIAVGPATVHQAHGLRRRMARREPLKHHEVPGEQAHRMPIDADLRQIARQRQQLTLDAPHPWEHGGCAQSVVEQHALGVGLAMSFGDEQIAQ